MANNSVRLPCLPLVVQNNELVSVADLFRIRTLILRVRICGQIVWSRALALGTFLHVFTEVTVAVIGIRSVPRVPLLIPFIGTVVRKI